MLGVDQLRSLASYYREIIASLASQSGRHLIDLGTNLRYGLTVDLGPYFPSPSLLIDQDSISFSVERVSPDSVSDVVQVAEQLEETSEPSSEPLSNPTSSDEQNLKSALTARLIAIYRKQHQDPFNRETILGYPVVAGRYGSIKFCAPLLYFPVNVQYDPLKSVFSITKQFESPTLNSHLLVKLTGSEDEATTIRREILPLIYQAEFDREALEKVIRVLGELAPGFRGLRKDSREAAPLADALEARDGEGSTLFRTAVLVNAKRTGAFLQDDLAELAKLEELNGETVVDTILADCAENIEEPTDPDDSGEESPLLFPLVSNKAQRFAARKAERAKLLVVQGPPGTGKSQTITNLVCHLAASGHSVLVTSHQNKALEVITQMMPQVDYLAMSLLKGEKESVTQLANQLERFSATVEGKTLTGLEDTRRRALSKLAETEAEIRQLTARFAELKLLERDSTTPYQRYDDIREYDGIDPEDQIPSGLEGPVAHALSEWLSNFRQLQPHAADLIRTFGNFGTDPSSTAERSNVLDELVTLFHDTASLAAQGESSARFVRELLREEEISASDRKYLAEWSSWLGKGKIEILSNLNALQQADIEPINVEQVLRQATNLGPKLAQNILQQAEETAEDASRLLRTWPPPSELPARPSETVLLSVENAVNDLNTRKDHWVSWCLSPSAASSRRTLQIVGLNKVLYREGKAVLSRLNSWVTVWKLRNAVLTGLKKLREAGVPLPEPSDESTVAFLGKTAIAGLAFAKLLACFSSRPHGPSNRTHREFIEHALCIITDDAQAEELVESLKQADQHLARIEALARLMRNPTFEAISELPKRYLNLALRSVQLSDHIRNEVRRWKTLLRLAGPYHQMLTLESTSLNCLFRTMTGLRKGCLAGKMPAWLENPDIAVEAHRLSGFIREDMTGNPDDIHEIANRIHDSYKTKQALVEDVIRRSRLVSLKQAEQDNATRFQIVKLRQLLRKKKKTPSLLQLRNQIEYERLLDVFPCWIMSIEDVARIFPLQPALFDYLIVDEASQCNQATTLHLAYRAKRMIVVGDRQQLKNANVRFLSDNLVRMLLAKYRLDSHPRAEFLHGRESLLALSEAASNSTAFLNEHFRCEPPIISWSNENFYAGQLRVLTPIRPRRFVPVADVRLVAGADDDLESKVNRVEANAVIAEVKRLIESGDAKDLDIGIISPYQAQATLLNNLLHETFSSNPTVLQHHRLVASTADGFQGDERDVILYSFRFGPSSSPGVVRAIELERERLNVAFSRARRKVISFTSRPVEAFPKGLVRSFIEHSIEVQKQSRARLSFETTDKFDSEFEKRVCAALRSRGLIVVTQLPCAGFFIDLVAMDSEGRRVAIECDGEFHYDDGELRPEDYQRQDIIERSGWTVYRVSTRKFYANPGAAVDSIVLQLKALPTESDLADSDISLTVENGADHIPLSESPPRGSVVPTPPMNFDPNSTESAEKSTAIMAEVLSLGTGAISVPANWEKINRWGWTSRKLNRYITWFCHDVAKRLTDDQKFSSELIDRAREIWDMAHRLGFDENQTS